MVVGGVVSSTGREDGICCQVWYAYTCVGLELFVSVGFCARLDVYASSQKT